MRVCARRMVKDVADIEFLGWNTSKTRFTAPGWEIQNSGLNPTAGLFHPRDKIRAYSRVLPSNGQPFAPEAFRQGDRRQGK